MIFRNKVYLTSFPASFWIINLVQMLEKLAYWCVLLQLPVYIAQKDVPGALHWDQALKGIIFFWWALFQNLTPLLTGGISDRYGHKKLIYYSYLFIISGYLILAFSRDFTSFLSGSIVLGIGSGIFKPAVQGSFAGTLNEKNSSAGWGIYFMLLNLAVFFAPPLSKTFKEISWNWIFWSAVLISAVNLIIVIISPRGTFASENKSADNLHVFKRTIQTLFTPKVFYLVLLMSGFSIIYMQFYETLPNFILDWSDTRMLAAHLPDFMTSVTPAGKMMSYEWLYNINSLLIIFFIAYVSVFNSKFRKETVLTAGIVLAIIGLIISGISTSAFILILGIIIYTFGEMSVNPKYTEKLASLSSPNNKALYMSYLNISSAIGLAFGSLAGAFLYREFAEKSTLAIRYLNSFYADVINYQVKPEDAVSTLASLKHITYFQANELLWNYYQPYLVWLPFVLIGVISALGMIYYRRKNSQ